MPQRSHFPGTTVALHLVAKGWITMGGSFGGPRVPVGVLTGGWNCIVITEDGQLLFVPRSSIEFDPEFAPR